LVALALIQGRAPRQHRESRSPRALLPLFPHRVASSQELNCKIEGREESAAPGTFALRDRIGVPCWPSRQSSYEHYVGLVRDSLDAECFRTIWQKGKLLVEDEAIDYGLKHFPAGPDMVAVVDEG
jgi:hypothetical protein